ncbi:hypothetical protein M8J77_011760 [Diaphorina citri]|nr:hypothetical protein M8J77_011760 [Diaphorina citri]
MRIYEGIQITDIIIVKLRPLAKRLGDDNKTRLVHEGIEESLCVNEERSLDPPDILQDIPQTSRDLNFVKNSLPMSNQPFSELVEMMVDVQGIQKKGSNQSSGCCCCCCSGFSCT